MRTGFIVPARSKVNIRGVVASLRNGLGPYMPNDGYVPIDRVYEALRVALPGFDFEVLDEAEMGSDHGRAYPDRRFIQLRRDVYDNACKGSGRDRFTAAHELGHIFLHAGATDFPRVMDSASSVPLYRNAEWQADTFASALLIDEARLALCHSIAEVQEKFGVSEAAARARFKK